jgi:hypothetical protein
MQPCQAGGAELFAEVIPDNVVHGNRAAAWPWGEQG